MNSRSLLALALGMGLNFIPQLGNAAVVYTDFNSYQVPSTNAGVVYIAPSGPLVGFKGMTAGSLEIDSDGNGVGFTNYRYTPGMDFGSGFTMPPSETAAYLYSSPNLIPITSTTISLGSIVDSSGNFPDWAQFDAVDSASEQFVGARAKSGSDYYYGWVGFTINNGVFTIEEAAFESTPNTAITVQAVPEISTLMLGALGAVGLIATRRRAGE